MNGPPHDGSLFTLDEVRHRLAGLRAELERLELDPQVFARAFHTQVARVTRAGPFATTGRTASPAQELSGCGDTDLLVYRRVSAVPN